MPYSPRTIDVVLDDVLPGAPALAIEGPKGVGKTATARRRARTVIALDVPAEREILAADPGAILSAETPVLMDEWQRAPEVWDVVRRAVDDGARPGSFLLTGSATPPNDIPIHSGAGRILSLRMRPMSMAERGTCQQTVSLSTLLGEGAGRVGGDCPLSLRDYTEEILRSGLPGIRDLPERNRRLQLDGYLTRLLSKELDEQGVRVRKPDSLRAWLTAYAAASSTVASYNDIRRAATPGDGDPPTKVTTIRYRDWLNMLWILDPVPAWWTPSRSLAALAQGPKHHLADPALTARLLRVTTDSLLRGATVDARVNPHQGALLGALFESLATLSLRVYAEALDATVSHLRTQRGEHEVDLLVEGPDGSVVAVEVKLSASVSDRDTRHLHWLRDKLGDRVVDLMVITTGPTAYRRGDGVAVVPLGLLGP